MPDLSSLTDVSAAGGSSTTQSFLQKLLGSTPEERKKNLDLISKLAKSAGNIEKSMADVRQAADGATIVQRAQAALQPINIPRDVDPAAAFDILRSLI